MVQYPSRNLVSVRNRPFEHSAIVRDSIAVKQELARLPHKMLKDGGFGCLAPMMQQGGCCA